jgi:glycosyltransferase A (GT-A) superfamily protein (DUF2064 family)
MARRILVLFAREPGREARAKGFPSREGADLFAEFAAGWLDAARRADAQLAIATPPEDRAAWRRRFSAFEEPLWLIQRGRSFGERLERTARVAATLGANAVLVGGDVVPSPETLEAAFRALERGASAVLAPTPDGGVSLVGLKPGDADLLRAIAPRRRDVFERLSRRLTARGRKAHVVGVAPDVDSRRELRFLLRAFPLTESLRRAARRVLFRVVRLTVTDCVFPRFWIPATPSGLRAPPE